ncbi:MAG: hypothetical protein QNJ07_13800 [Woeseiaceae bacterium]|nr:hypothetical protein [Woeseiaceae bacterium]
MTIDRHRRIVDVNDVAIRTFAGSIEPETPQLGQLEIEWLITEVANRFWRSGESVKRLLDAEEHYLSVIARRLDGMKFHADVRIVPTGDDEDVSHILYLRGASERAVF